MQPSTSHALDNPHDGQPPTFQSDQEVADEEVAVPAVVAEADDSRPDLPSAPAIPASTPRVGAPPDLRAEEDPAGVNTTAEIFPEARARRPILRHGLPRDAGTLAQLLISSKADRALAACGLADPAGAPRLDVVTAGLEEILAAASNRIWVAHVSQAPVGLAMVAWRHDPVRQGVVSSLEMLFVQPEWRERGTGTQLIHACRATARVAQADRLFLGPAIAAVIRTTKRFLQNRGFADGPMGLSREP